MPLTVAHHPIPRRRVEWRRTHLLAWETLRPRWWLLLIAFVGGGVYEVMDNLLGLRQLNFESSAPAVVKVAKELAILWLLIGIAKRSRPPNITPIGLVIGSAVLLCFIPQVLSPPSQTHSMAGLLYFAFSAIVLLAACALLQPGPRNGFARHFVLPVVVVILATQLLEAWFAPSSFYFETNLLGMDRRAGIAVIPTTAGLLGVVGVAVLTGPFRVVAALVIGMASSTLSLLCLMVILVDQVRPRIYLVLALPVIAVAAALAINTREGLDLTIASRLYILEESLTQLTWFGPSAVGALATAKSVALAPSESVIIDSFYLEVFHVLGVMPGLLFIAALFAALYRRAGSVALAVFAIAGVGFLVLEGWVVWLAILHGLSRSAPTRTARRHRRVALSSES